MVLIFCFELMSDCVSTRTKYCYKAMEEHATCKCPFMSLTWQDSLCN